MAFIVCLEVHETHSLSSLNRLARQSKHVPCFTPRGTSVLKLDENKQDIEAFVDFVTIFFFRESFVFFFRFIS